MLNSMAEKSEKDEIAFELLPNMSYPQIDITKRGESIYLEQEISKDNATKLLNDCLRNIKINLKENCFHFLDSFCKIDTTFPIEISKKWNDLSSKSKSSNYSFFPNNYKFDKTHTMSLEDKILSKCGEKIAKMNANQEKSTEMNANFLNDDDNDLLSSALINFTLTEIHEPTSNNQPVLAKNVNQKNLSDNSIVYSNNSHINSSSNHGQNASGFGNLTPIRSSNDIPVGNNNQKVLTESLVNNQPQKRNAPSNEKEVRGNTPNTDRKLFMNDSGTNNNGSKLYKKKIKFMIAEKFEPVLEGLKKDALDIADFTGAGCY